MKTWRRYPFSLITIFDSAENVAAASSLANAASPVIIIVSKPNLFVNLCNHPLLWINDVETLILGNPLLKSLYIVLVLSGTCRHNLDYLFCLCLPSQIQCFFHLNQALDMYYGYNLPILRCDSKTSTNFFFLHNIKDRRFVLTVDLSSLNIWLFSFYKLTTLTFLLTGSS